MSLQIININSLVGNCCFNGSLFVKHNNKYFSQYILKNDIDFQIYCVYRSTPTKEDYLNSSLRITPLNINTMICDISNNITLFENMSHEDPRVMCLYDKLFISYSKIIVTLNHRYRYRNNNSLSIKMQGSFLDLNFKEENIITFDNLNNKSSKQKNWTFFVHHELVHILYNIMPLQIFIWNNKNDLIKCDNVLPIISREWVHPLYSNIILRGGCPPIRIDNIYYVFVHSVDYKIFCLTLDDINFDILQVTKTELLNNKEKEKDEISNNSEIKIDSIIYFPCGVIFDFNNDTFYVSLGVDDINLGILTISKKELDIMLINVNVNVTVSNSNNDSVILKDNIIIEEFNENNMNLWINSWGGCDLFSNYLDRNGIKCKNIIWDKLLCHSVKYFNIPIKKIYIIADPLLSLSTTLIYNNQYKNLCKLSNQKCVDFSFTALLYFMWIQLRNWSCKEKEKDVYIIKEFNIKDNKESIEKFIGVSDILNNYPFYDKNINTDKIDSYNIQIIKNKFITENYDINTFLIENIMILYNNIL